MRRALIKIAAITILSFFCCRYFDYSESTIISSDFILSSSLEILGIALAVTAIFFTVIDRYKDKQEDKKSLEKKCFPVLKEMCENVLGILVVVIFIFITATVEPLLETISAPKYFDNFPIALFISLAGFGVIMLIVFDITISILRLTQALFMPINAKGTDNDKYVQLIDMCKKLDNKHFSELMEYLKTLYVKQAIERGNDKTSK